VIIVLRLRRPRLARPYRSPLGIVGALVTLTGVISVGVWFTLGIIWFALVGQNHLVLAPEEAFAIGASESE
jgi:ethanolamine permease